MTAEELVAGMRALIAKHELPAPPPPPVVLVVPSGGSIQDALATPAETIELQAGGSYAGFDIARPVVLRCHGARIHGDGRPAIRVVPGPASTDILILDAECSSTFQAVIQLGDNGPTQSRLEDVPRRIRLIRPVILGHHHAQAKNGIENNAAQVEILEPTIRDLYNPQSVESHGIITINTPGGLLVKGGVVDGGSTPLFTGGDAIDIPETDIADITYHGVAVTRDQLLLAGPNYNYKNLIEFKNVTRAKVLLCRISNNAGPIQKGFAVMCTPKVDGRVVDVEFNGNDIFNVGSGFNILGTNPSGLDVTRTDDIRILNNVVTIDKTAYGPGAFGWFLLLSKGPGRILVEGNTVSHNGNAFIYVDDRERIQSLIVRGNNFNAGVYGIRTPAGNNGTAWQEVFDELICEGNTISGASAVFKKSFPNNIFST